MVFRNFEIRKASNFVFEGFQRKDLQEQLIEEIDNTFKKAFKVASKDEYPFRNSKQRIYHLDQLQDFKNRETLDLKVEKHESVKKRMDLVYVLDEFVMAIVEVVYESNLVEWQSNLALVRGKHWQLEGPP